MPTLSAAISVTVFIVVILAIVTEKTHMTVAAMFGALLLVFTNVMSLSEAIDYIAQSYPTLALFLGVMVLIRTLEPTQIFAYLAGQMVKIARGSGKLLLLGIVAITTPICAVLPNATTVMLLAPLIPPLAQDIGIDFVPLLILMVVVSNSAGLLTLVGDPATFIVGDAVNISFNDYLREVSLGGVLAIGTILLLIPTLFRKTWKTNFSGYETLKLPTLEHPKALAIGAIITAFVLIFFAIGETLPTPISPAAVALMGAALSLMLAYHSKIDTIQKILGDIDWSTLIFFMSVFILIGGMEKTGVINQLSQVLAITLGGNLALGSILLIFVVGLLSSAVPNIPLVVAMVPLLKQYLFEVNLTGAETLNPDFTGQFPPEVLPIFYAMMFGATLGGNGTLVGASANIVAAGISELHGQKISFGIFLRYGFPIMSAQLVVMALFMSIFYL
jgi:Na+/H+ antiporter NhaD/arsenite permease-like protein